jgi:hypothetical protein
MTEWMEKYHCLIKLITGSIDEIDDEENPTKSSESLPIYAPSLDILPSTHNMTEKIKHAIMSSSSSSTLISQAKEIRKSIDSSSRSS